MTSSNRPYPISSRLSGGCPERDQLVSTNRCHGRRIQLGGGAIRTQVRDRFRSVDNLGLATT